MSSKYAGNCLQDFCRDHGIDSIRYPGTWNKLCPNNSSLSIMGHCFFTAIHNEGDGLTVCEQLSWCYELWLVLILILPSKLLLWTFLCNFINMRPWHFATGRCMAFKSEGWLANMFALFCSHRAIQTEDTQNGNFCALRGHIPVSEASCASVDINWHMNM